VQQIEGVTCATGAARTANSRPADIPDVVIEFFGVDIPPGYVAAMAQCEPRPVWINLRRAERRGMGRRLPPAAVHASAPEADQAFLLPGLYDKTGGLLRERGLLEERERFQADPAAMPAFLARFGVTRAEMARARSACSAIRTRRWPNCSRRGSRAGRP
jgi:hypothetical protein